MNALFSAVDLIKTDLEHSTPVLAGLLVIRDATAAVSRAMVGSIGISTYDHKVAVDKSH